MTSMISALAALLLTTGATVAPAKFEQIDPVSNNKVTAYNHALPRQTDDASKEIFIVRFDAPSAVNYHENIITAGRHQLSALTAADKRRAVSAGSDVTQYVARLKEEQSAHISSMQHAVGPFRVLTHYRYAFNGIAINASAKQAAMLRNFPGVKKVEADAVRQLTTDTGPLLIGAESIWSGLSGAATQTLGEGITVAVLDTGINTGHPSFAATGADGYTHTNPLGPGRYLGDCNKGFATLCNDKLIGVYSYPAITDVYSDEDIFARVLPANGEDYNGHGTHVAATAAGNILTNVAEVLPDAGQNQSEGIESGFVYDQIAGVAPHANIVSFQVCLPGEDDDTYNGCYDSVIARAIEDAIASGVVDIINFSISGGGDPWTGAVNEAWLAAHSAGIFTTHSASNSGPDAYTTEKQSPWMTVVGASTHGRLVDYEKQINSFNGGTFTPAPITGSSNTGEIRAPVIYAGNVPNDNDPGNDPAQCLEPYPAGTFNGEIVVCDRGDIARIEKAKNVAAGGAGGFVLANVEGGATNLANDTYVVPGIHIDASDATALKNWLASGDNHVATITAADGGISVDPDAADIVADFSSRGPNSLISTLTPHLTAPGVDIFAAYSDEQYGHDISDPAPADFAYLSGTSMASPHVAGAAALIKAVHPDWSPDEIRSAMMLTAHTAVSSGNSGRAANWFEMGAGRVQVDAAIRSSLIMEETSARYLAANPAEGGDPRDLNMPAVIDSECFTNCQWQRTVTATQDGTWTTEAISQDAGFLVSVSPASFNLAAGESQILTIIMNTESLSSNQRGFGQIAITDASGNNLHIPVVAFASNGTIPDSVDIQAHRDYDSLSIEDVYTSEVDALTVTSFGLINGSRTEQMLAPDSDNSAVLDDIEDGLYLLPVTVTENDLRLVAEITQSSAQDLDLYVVFDENQNGLPEETEIVAESTSFSVVEYINLNQPDAGDYWVVVQNWAGSGAARDAFTLFTAVLDRSEKSNLTVEAPATLAAEEEFDLQISWALSQAEPGDRYYGAFELNSSAQATGDIGLTTVDLVREQDDVYLTSSAPARVAPGDRVPFTVNILTNDTQQDRDYVIDVLLGDTLTLVEDSVSGAASVSDNVLTWQVTQPAVERPEHNVAMTTGDTDLQCHQSGQQLNTLAGWQPAKADTAAFKTYNIDSSYMGNAFSYMTILREGAVNFDPTLSALPGNANNAFAQINAVISARGDTENMASRVLQNAQDQTIVQWTTPDAGTHVLLMLDSSERDSQPAIVMAYPSIAKGASATLINNKRKVWSSDNAMDIANGDVLCFYPMDNAVQVIEQLQFEAIVQQNAMPGPLDIQVRSRVTNVLNTQEETAASFTGVQIDAPPRVTIDGPELVNLVAGQSIQVSATASDANSDELRFQWQVEAASGVTLSNAQSETVTLRASGISEATTLTLQVTVDDGFANQATDSVTVQITPARSSGGGDAGGGSMHYIVLCCLLIMVCQRAWSRQ